MTIQVDDIIEHAASSAFGNKRVTNIHRAILVEAIVDKALSSHGWKWCSADYSGWDFEHHLGTRLEVKQSSALQSWKTAKPSAPIFDIAPRTGFWKNGIEWVPEVGRHTDIYLFAHHPVEDISIADHRDPYQWDFYVLGSSQIVAPKQKTISLSSIRFLKASACKFDGLVDAVETARLKARRNDYKAVKRTD